MVHDLASSGFSAGAATYQAARPEYPPEIEQWLTTDLNVSAKSKVLDLGAGTGKFSARLLAVGARVLAVDAVPEMLAQLTATQPEVEARQGSAEELPLESASVDAVVCAQAFHWFASEQSLNEIRRVLKPKGHLGLVWNVRDESVAWVAALTKIMEPFEGEAPRYTSQAWRSHFPADGFSALRERSFVNHQSGSPEQVILDRVLSVSFIAALPREEQQAVATRVRELIARMPELAGKAVVTFPYVTAAFSCSKLP